MISSKDFFEQLREGQEYTSCLMTMSTYNGIDHELKQLMYQGDIRQKNLKFKDDEILQQLKKVAYKASKAVKNREYDINHNL